MACCVSMVSLLCPQRHCIPVDKDAGSRGVSPEAGGIRLCHHSWGRACQETRGTGGQLQQWPWGTWGLYIGPGLTCFKLKSDHSDVWRFFSLCSRLYMIRRRCLIVSAEVFFFWFFFSFFLLRLPTQLHNIGSDSDKHSWMTFIFGIGLP